MSTLVDKTADVIYPDSDGQPMADNTEQWDLIALVKLNVEAIFANREDVFVAGDLLWYYVEGDPRSRVAPDVLVAFGRPKGPRGSYIQWREGGVTPQVVFEVLSPGNTAMEMTRKCSLYERLGVEEYYMLDPDVPDAVGWRREGEGFRSVDPIDGWTSPRLGIRFEVREGSLQLFRPDGSPFKDFVELSREADEARNAAEQARADASQARADASQARADASQARADAEEAQRRAELLAEKLRALGVKSRRTLANRSYATRRASMARATLRAHAPSKSRMIRSAGQIPSTTTDSTSGSR